MSIENRSGRTRGVLAMAVAAAVTASGLAGVAGAGPAGADPVTLPLDYQCVFPLLGPQPVQVRISTDVPASVKVGEVMPGFAVDSVSTVNAASARGLVAVHSVTLEGIAAADALLTVPEAPEGLEVRVDSDLDKTTLPASGGFTVQGKGKSPDLTFTQAGPGKVTVGDLVLTLTPRAADGLETGLGTFESECTQNPGQNNVLATFDITEPGGGEPSAHAYSLNGSSTIKAGGGWTVPLRGGLDASLDAGTGKLTGDLALDPAKGEFKILGFLPVTADIAYAAQGKTTGTFANGTLTTAGQVITKLPSLTVFGAIPIGGGEKCQTAKPSEIALTSDGTFDPAKGGTVKGAYELAPLTDCGPLTGLLSSSIAGPGNTVQLSLTPKPER
ncbi:DUF6801 domain-containing protein [Actinomadura sp. 9N407]|uniref:DUF6801 domain-containing protein n=1 Tax=Actinomadura sp. 9N407 TaxID=3375154 RepID=UPI003789C2C8